MDIETQPTLRQALRMYAETCCADRIDCDAFAAVLRRHAFPALDARACVAMNGEGGAARAESEQRLLDRLEPLFATALHSVGPSRLLELDRLGYGHGLAVKWAVLEVNPLTPGPVTMPRPIRSPARAACVLRRICGPSNPRCGRSVTRLRFGAARAPVRVCAMRAAGLVDGEKTGLLLRRTSSRGDSGRSWPGRCTTTSSTAPAAQPERARPAEPSPAPLPMPSPPPPPPPPPPQAPGTTGRGRFGASGDAAPSP